MVEVAVLFTMCGGGGNGDGDDHFIVNWHTDQFGFDDTKTYRIRVLVVGTELGYADVDVVNSGKELKNVVTEESKPLVDGRTLPIKFRIEEGAVFVVGSSGGTIVALEGEVALEVPPAALTKEVGITVEYFEFNSDYLADTGILAGTVFHFSPEGTVFEEPVQICKSHVKRERCWL